MISKSVLSHQDGGKGASSRDDSKTNNRKMVQEHQNLHNNAGCSTSSVTKATTTTTIVTASSSACCAQMDCHRTRYGQWQHCKHHFAQRVKKAFRVHFKSMYRGPERAFNVLDFTGKGYILA